MKCECSSCFHGSDVIEESDEVDFNLSASNARCLHENLRTRFYCCELRDRLGSFRERHGMCESGSLDIDFDELGFEAVENENFKCVKIANPEIPFIKEIPICLDVGTSIDICGRTLGNFRRFSINLSADKWHDSDLALHFNPRYDRRVIIRNHRTCNKWGREELLSLQPFPFRPQKGFSIIILIVDEQFMITVNKVHYCAFAFRIPVKCINYLIITGDIALSSIEYGTKCQYPPRILTKTPYVVLPRTGDRQEMKCAIRRKVKAITAGTIIEIFGRLKLMPRGFYINLQNGTDLWPHPLIPFHMSVRIYPPLIHKREQEIIFNTWLIRGWGKETIISLCPFMAGTDFYMTINCEPTSFAVKVNNKFLYKQKITGHVPVNSVVAFGDVIIKKVVFRGTSRKLIQD